MPYTIVPFDGDGDDALGDDWAIPVATAIAELQIRLGLVAAPAFHVNPSLNYTSTVSDVTGLSRAFTAIAEVRYRTRVFLPSMLQNVAAGEVQLQICDGANVALNRSFKDFPIGHDDHMSCEHLDAGIAGNHTRKARLLTSDGDLDLFGSNDLYGILTIEAIGNV